MKTLYKYEFRYYRKPIKYTFDKDIFEQSEVKVLGENDTYLVLDDYFFTKLSKKNNSGYNLYSVINRPSINVTLNDHLFQDRVTYLLYTENKKRPSTIRKEINNYIENKVGWLGFDLDLSLIK